MSPRANTDKPRLDGLQSPVRASHLLSETGLLDRVLPI